MSRALPPLPLFPSPVLVEGLRRLGDRWPEFVEQCHRHLNGRQSRQASLARHRICRRYTLSYEKLNALEVFLRAEIAAWPNEPADNVAAGRSVLPPGDRD